jgi:hypothetical protein
MSLFRVTIEVDILVCAESREAAEKWALDNTYDWQSDAYDWDATAWQIRTKDQIPHAWCGALVYGDHSEDMTAEAALEITP